MKQYLSHLALLLLFGIIQQRCWRMLCWCGFPVPGWVVHHPLFAGKPPLFCIWPSVTSTVETIGPIYRCPSTEWNCGSEQAFLICLCNIDYCIVLMQYCALGWTQRSHCVSLGQCTKANDVFVGFKYKTSQVLNVLFILNHHQQWYLLKALQWILNTAQ